MEKKHIGAGLVLDLVAGIIMHNLALGIMLGLALGAGTSAVKASRTKP